MSARNMESTGKKSVWNGRTPPDSGYGPTPEVLDAINLNKQGLKAGIEQALKDEIMHCIEGVSVLIRCVLSQSSLLSIGAYAWWTTLIDIPLLGWSMEFATENSTCPLPRMERLLGRSILCTFPREKTTILLQRANPSRSLRTTSTEMTQSRYPPGCCSL